MGMGEVGLRKARQMQKLILVLLTIGLSGCNSLGFKPIVQNVATTGVAYAIGGPLPAIVNATVMVATEEFIAEDTKVGEIKSTEQAVAYIAEKGFMYSLYGLVAFFAFTTIVGPWVASKRSSRKGYEKAKKKYKTQVRISQDVIDQIKGTSK
jgi:hypothetical protein